MVNIKPGADIGLLFPTNRTKNVVHFFGDKYAAGFFFKNSFLDRIQIGKETGTYKKLGVHIVNRVAQNGVIINALIKRKFPDYKAVTNRKSSIAKLIGQTYVFEKFHLIFFLFFSTVITYAAIQGQFLSAFIILLTNVAYNIYPNFLQQYIRLKLKLYSKTVYDKRRSTI